MDLEEIELIDALLAKLQARRVTKFETPDMCLELQPVWPAPPDMAAGSPEEDDFDPAKAYQKSIDEAAEAIRVAAAKRE